MIAKFLKELGIPSPGVTQGAVVYAGYLLTLGNPVGILIVGVVLIGFMGGSATAYSNSYYLGDRLANPVGRFLRISPERMEKARNTIVVKSRWIVIVGRFVRALMLPLSLAAHTVRLPLQRFYTGTGLAMMLWVVFFAAARVLHKHITVDDP